MKNAQRLPESAERAEQKLPSDALTAGDQTQQLRRSSQTRVKHDFADSESPEFSRGGSMTEPPATRRPRRSSQRSFQSWD
jgi:hypothetical protein